VLRVCIELREPLHFVLISVSRTSHNTSIIDHKLQHADMFITINGACKVDNDGSAAAALRSINFKFDTFVGFQPLTWRTLVKTHNETGGTHQPRPAPFCRLQGAGTIRGRRFGMIAKSGGLWDGSPPEESRGGASVRVLRDEAHKHLY